MSGVGQPAILHLGGVEADGGVAAACKHHSDGVVALLQEVRHVVGVEIDSLAVVGEGGLEDFLGGNFVTVDVGAVLP